MNHVNGGNILLLDNVENSENKKGNLLSISNLIKNVSGLIQKSLEHSYEISELNDYYAELSLDIQKLFFYLLDNSFDLKNFDASSNINNIFLSSYITGFGENPYLSINKEKIYNKINKNLLIYLPILINFIRKEIEFKKIHIKSEESFKIIKEYVNKILIFLLIYGDKIDFNFIKTILNKDLNELKMIKKEFLLKSQKLDNVEFTFNEKFKNHNEKVVKIKPFENYFVYSSAYRYSFKFAQDKVIKDLNKKNKNIKFKDQNGVDDEIINEAENISVDEKFNQYLAESLENQIGITFLEQYDIFIKTIELNVELDLRLEKLSNSFLKLLNFIYILCEENIAFLDFKGKFSDENYIDNLLSKIFNLKPNSSKINKVFIKFLKLTDNRFNNLFNYSFKDLKNEIIIDNKKHVEIPYRLSEDIDISTLDLKTLTLDKWESIDIDNRYDIFLTKIFIINNNDKNIKINKLLNLNSKNTKYLIEIFAILHGDDKKIITNQIADINKIISNGISLEGFIEYDLNNVLFLYQWWRFILFLNKFDGRKEISVYEKHFSKKLTGLNDIIIKKLSEKKLLDENLDISPKGRLYNMSVANIGLKINGSFKSLAKGNINLNKLLINYNDLENGKSGEYIFSDKTELYCPNEICSYEEAYNYIETGINALRKVLQLKKSFSNEDENKYIILIKSLGIIDNLDKLKENEKNNIAKLIEALKVVKSKLNDLNIMCNIAFDDSVFIKKTFENLLKGRGNVGDKKNFGRALIKLISSYNGDLNKLGDLTRLRIEGKTFDEVINLFLEYIRIANETTKINEISKDKTRIIKISIDDFAGHLFSFSKKPSGYRDLKTLFTLSSGNVVEFQFHFTELHNKKINGIELNQKIKNKLDIELSLLSLDEIYYFIKLYIDETGIFPSIDLLENISGIEGNIIINSEEYNFILNDYKNKTDNIVYKNNISGDIIYHIRRKITDKKSLLGKKLERLERILFEDAWGKIIIEYCKNKGLIN